MSRNYNRKSKPRKTTRRRPARKTTRRRNTRRAMSSKLPPIQVLPSWPNHLKVAESEIGKIKEVRGRAQNNPVIIDMFRAVGHEEIDNDETSWCAAYVGSRLEAQGISSTGRLDARSYKSWGWEVGRPGDLSRCRPGDVVVFWRQDPKSWKGHVAFYVAHDESYIYVIGGNQRNNVTYAAYPMERLLSVRRSRRVKEEERLPNVRSGSKITEQLILGLAPRANRRIVKEMVPVLNKLGPTYEITTPRRMALFLANCAAETGGFRALEENLNYSARRLRQVWPRRFRTAAKARAYANNPEKLANLVYNRYGNKGKRGYGWKYRGRGFMQTTFVDNYRKVQQVTGMPVVENPDLLKDVKKGLEAAMVYWKQSGCNALADANRITDCRRKINGGTHGLTYVKKFYRAALPKMKGLDLTNSVAKTVTTTVGGGGGTAVPFYKEPVFWMVMTGVAVLGLCVYVYWRQRRSKDVDKAVKDVDVSLHSDNAPGLEDLSDQHRVDRGVHRDLGPTRDAELLPGVGPEQLAA